MAEKLEVSYKARRLPENNEVYIEYHIDNMGIEDVAFHGVTLPMSEMSIKDMCEDYKPTALGELFIAVDGFFPSDYTNQ